jgi:hypothetical protein
MTIGYASVSTVRPWRRGRPMGGHHICSGRLMLTVLSAIVEFERGLILQRTNEAPVP